MPHKQDSRPQFVKHPWNAPLIGDLPPLQDLTLQSPIEGGEGGFSWLNLSNTERHLG